MRRTTASVRIFRGFRQPSGWCWRCSRNACLIPEQTDPRHGYGIGVGTHADALADALHHLAIFHRLDEQVK